MGTKVSAEQVLFESNYARVFKAVYLYCCSYNITEDAVQEAFLRAHKNIHKLRKKESFAAWVTSIAINVIRSEFNKKNNVSQITLELVENQLPNRNSDFEVVEHKDAVQRLLNSLNETERETLILRYMFDLSVEEIAELTNISAAGIKSRLFRVKQKVRTKYQRGVLADE
ncbi:MAG: RNA polymerase sigma factor [Dethiobacteraceae bacterium]|jgi:RNA polymerase sigma-70 factor (ECF subfamily)|nr:RNA polymerase sigma factor [Bacillota bacterium]